MGTYGKGVLGDFLTQEERQVTIRVKRYIPEGDGQPFFQDFTVPFRGDMVVLDGLVYIKEQLDGSLTYRWSCRMGVCGSCGATVNGTPRLTCETLLKDLKSPIVTVEPLYNFPVIKDLVVDIDDFMKKLQDIKPWIIRKTERTLKEGEFIQKPEDIDLYRQFSSCINCMLCLAACPVYASDRQFVGPAPAALALRYILDTRDQGKESRLNILTGEGGIWDCTFAGNCTVVCPKNVDPAMALQRLKVMSVNELVKEILMPGLKGGE